MNFTYQMIRFQNLFKALLFVCVFLAVVIGATSADPVLAGPNANGP